MEKYDVFLGFSNNSHDDSLYRFRKSVVDKVKLDISILMNRIIQKNRKVELNIQMNSFITWDLVILQHVLVISILM